MSNCALKCSNSLTTAPGGQKPSWIGHLWCDETTRNLIKFLFHDISNIDIFSIHLFCQDPVCSECDIISWWRLGTFVDEEAGVYEQPVAILLCWLQGQSRRQLILQEGQRHALLQVVGGGREAGRQPASTAGDHREFSFNSFHFLQIFSEVKRQWWRWLNISHTWGCVPALRPGAPRTQVHPGSVGSSWSQHTGPESLLYLLSESWETPIRIH